MNKIRSTIGMLILLVFIMLNAIPELCLNGEKVGSWVYGYNSFWIETRDAASLQVRTESGIETSLVVYFL